MRKKVSIDSFEGNLGKITEIQKEFFKEASDFVYFRKGEFDNAAEIARFVVTILSGIVAVKVIASDLIRLVQQGKFRVISSETESNKEHLKKLKEKGARISIIVEQETGKLRYFVNEKRFCLFIRQRGDKFFGVIGTDPLMISQLKELFEQDFKE